MNTLTGIMVPSTRRDRWFLFTVIAFIWIMASSPLKAQTEKESNARKVDELFSQYSTQDSPGAAVVIVKDGEVILDRAYGSANLEYNIPITPSTVFHVGSVSKQFTGFAILILEDEGKLSLDDDIRKYLPEVHDFGATITIRHLLRHMSGLREQENLLDLCGISTADVITTEHLMKIVGRQKELNFKPGDEIEYCNTGYFLLAQIVERIAGMSFRDWAGENIFNPLGMAHTECYDDNGRIVKNRAYPYYIPEGKQQLTKGILSYSYVGPTSVFTTSDDIAKWLINFTNPKVGNDRMMRKMLFETDHLNNGDLVDYSYGIAVTTYKGLRINFHSGGDAGYRAYDAYFPDQRLGIAILSNFYSLNPQLLGLKIADLYLKDAFPPEQPKTDPADEPRSQKPDSTRQFSLPYEQLPEYTGDFFSEELETRYTILLYKNGLVVKHWRMSDVVLTPAEIDTFTGDYPMDKLHFIRDIQNHITGFRITAGRVRNLLFNKM